MFCAQAFAEISSNWVRVKPIGQGATPGVSVPGEIRARLNLPPGESLSAVIIVHGSGGIDERGPFYAKALNEAGIATLELDLWTARGVTGISTRPKTTLDTLPDVWGGWLYLAGHPKIDRNRIGITGFSWGGVLSWISAFSIRPANSPPEILQAKFQAHVPIYPICSSFLAGTRGKAALDAFAPSGAPVLIINGTQDDYDIDSKDCEKLPALYAKVPLTVLMLEGATHSFEVALTNSFFDPRAKDGKGGTIQIRPNPELAIRSRQAVVEFFKAQLK